MIVNSNFQLLPDTYLFAEVGARVRKFKENHPEAEVIRMDIGDVTLPIARAVADAMKSAVDEMLHADTFHGYGPEQGYMFLREAIAANDYAARGIEVQPEEIFISDGAKCDVGNLTDIFGADCIVGIPNPVYPVYVDSNIMAGRTVEDGKIKFIECNAAGGYKPMVPDEKVDIIYLCSPNNPTGIVLDAEDLQKWVNYAVANNSLIIFDSAYESFVRTPGLPRSIYEIEGAKRVAIEVRSFSKTAGFTGLRCGYTVVPTDLYREFRNGKQASLHKLWLRRQTTKFNGASYIIQRGAAAVYTPEGRLQVNEATDYYLRNSSVLAAGIKDLGLDATGGTDSPYVWVKAPESYTSWELFDKLLYECHLSTTPGAGFGSGGEGCIRLTGFNTYENTLEAVKRLKKLKL